MVTRKGDESNGNGGRYISSIWVAELISLCMVNIEIPENKIKKDKSELQ